MNRNRLALGRTAWMRGAIRVIVPLTIVMVSAGAVARLPPPSDADKALATEAAAKAAWNDKIGQFQLCAAMDRVADGYRRSTVAAGKNVPAPAPTAACTDPGPYVSSAKPLEAAGAHSPAATAVSPPSTLAPAAEIATGTKK